MTIYDIAEIAGMSASSVSRVLNNRPGISEKNRKRVQDILKEYNYAPDQAARGLVMQSTRIIGILMEDIRLSHHTESTYVVEQELMKEGYTCIAMNTGREAQRKAECIRVMQERRVEGVILIGSMFCEPEIAESIRKYLPQIPVVIVNGYLDLPNVYGVLTDEKGGVEACVDRLIQKGRRNQAFLMDTSSPANDRKKEGFMDGMRKNGIPEDEIRIYINDSEDLNPELTIDRGEMLTSRVLKENPEVNGLIYSVDLLAIGGLRALERAGINVPERVSVIGIDNTIYGKICRPTLTTLDNKLVEVSQNASRVLLNALNQKNISHKMMLFTEIIERESL